MTPTMRDTSTGHETDTLTADEAEVLTFVLTIFVDFTVRDTECRHFEQRITSSCTALWASLAIDLRGLT